MKCKFCNSEIKVSNRPKMLEGFCSEKCFWDYDDITGVTLVEYSETDLIGVSKKKKEPEHDFVFFFELPIKRRGSFIISQASLDEIYYGISGSSVLTPKAIEFNKFLKDNNLVVEKIGFSEHCIIKKVRK